jgi:hypothetical protein
MKPVLVLAAIMCVSAIGGLAAQDSAATAALAKLRTLVGDWEGSYTWSGARTESGHITATYVLTGHGSAVVENLTMGDPGPTGISMSSVYHKDGADLRVTHYCAAQNQPRLKAGRIDVAEGRLSFEFVDITNLSSPKAPFMNGLEMQIVDANHITLTFRSVADSQTSYERIEMTRKPQTHGL